MSGGWNQFSKYWPDIVFHAAAHKHVPLMEDSPNEAIKNNVIGTLKRRAQQSHYQVKKFILSINRQRQSTRPTSWGASKRLCEMVIQLIGRHSTTEFAAVRFGNVLGSNGSVIPLFRRQDRTRRSGDGYASGYHSIFYDDSGGSQPCTQAKPMRKTVRSLS